MSFISSNSFLDLSREICFKAISKSKLECDDKEGAPGEEADSGAGGGSVFVDDVMSGKEADTMGDESMELMWPSNADVRKGRLLCSITLCLNFSISCVGLNCVIESFRSFKFLSESLSRFFRFWASFPRNKASLSVLTLSKMSNFVLIMLSTKSLGADPFLSLYSLYNYYNSTITLAD